MKKLKTFIFILFIIISFSACSKILPNRTEIDDITYIQAVGIDKAKDENVVITFVSKHIEISGGQGAGLTKKTNVLSAEGRTIFEAVRKFHSFSEKRIFWGHNKFIIFGEETAKEGILEYLDFMIRDHELRLRPNVVVVKGATAKEFLSETNTSEYFISERLENLITNTEALSVSGEVRLLDLVKLIQSPSGGQYVPFVSMIREEQSDSGQEVRRKYKVILEGYSILKDEKLIGYLTDGKARGLNWILNKIKSGVIVVQDISDKNVSLEIIDSTTKIVPKLESNNLSILIQIRMSSNISEVEPIKNVFNKKALDFLKDRQEDIIRQEVEEVIKFAQDNEVDFIGFSGYVQRKYPIKWKTMEKDWKSIFPKTKFSVSVESKINRSYSIREPIKVKVGGE